MKFCRTVGVSALLTNQINIVLNRDIYIWCPLALVSRSSTTEMLMLMVSQIRIYLQLMSNIIGAKTVLVGEVDSNLNVCFLWHYLDWLKWKALLRKAQQLSFLKCLYNFLNTFKSIKMIRRLETGSIKNNPSYATKIPVLWCIKMAIRTLVWILETPYQ